MALPVVAVTLCGAAIAFALWTAHRPITVSTVTEDLRQLVLYRSNHPARDDGGPVGPWWVIARSLDPVSGRLLNLRISCEDRQIAARSAKVTINPDDDTFSFDLEGVVITRFPPDSSEEPHEERLLTLDRYQLGPVPYGRNIVPDRVSDRRRVVTAAP